MLLSGGASAAENADSDGDLEVVADTVSVNLDCPMSGSRIKIAGRFKPCIHMGCFDLETFVELNQRSRKWQCQFVLKLFFRKIIIDPFFNRITSLMKNCGEDVNEIDVKNRMVLGMQKFLVISKDLLQWHMPDGTLCVGTDVESKPTWNSQARLNKVISEGYTSLKLDKSVEFCHNVIPTSSSATESYRDGEDPSVNQDGGGNFGLHCPDLDSISLDLYKIVDGCPQLLWKIHTCRSGLRTDAASFLDFCDNSPDDFWNPLFGHCKLALRMVLALGSLVLMVMVLMLFFAGLGQNDFNLGSNAVMTHHCKIFLPNQPSASVPSETNLHSEIGNGISPDDWFLLALVAVANNV
ncbi:hypothetical protein HPP92_018894 [Vanilla planifolia]|uniref:SP-RING-type domain-containing protein n=1 Tax=Vanilla planifolia TaxID=51239 RepID=A0A835Q5S8_VANPL|nr:hypothetical protein HPP92_018894 [Vanilla planifolia]